MNTDELIDSLYKDYCIEIEACDTDAYLSVYVRAMSKKHAETFLEDIVADFMHRTCSHVVKALITPRMNIIDIHNPEIIGATCRASHKKNGKLLIGLILRVVLNTETLTEAEVLQYYTCPESTSSKAVKMLAEANVRAFMKMQKHRLCVRKANGCYFIMPVTNWLTNMYYDLRIYKK
jgi:hypothetical protein